MCARFEQCRNLDVDKGKSGGTEIVICFFGFLVIPRICVCVWISCFWLKHQRLCTVLLLSLLSPKTIWKLCSSVGCRFFFSFFLSLSAQTVSNVEKSRTKQTFNFSFQFSDFPSKNHLRQVYENMHSHTDNNDCCSSSTTIIIILITIMMKKNNNRRDEKAG